MMEIRLAIIGLGYVGLPLALEFSKKRCVIGFDLNNNRINELINGFDRTSEVESKDLINSQCLFTSNINDIRDCNVYIISVPTPIDTYKRPDLTPLLNASRLVGELITLGNIVIYESTVYPGATEENCVPVLEQFSNLIYNQDFFVGYSPERINPGDKQYRLPNIKKITSGSTQLIASTVDDLYNEIILAGTFKASSIKVAEAAKVIENTQRDINIALMNELSILFSNLGIDTHEVLSAADTKWNFLPFKPGFVGGHCIGVDPYYLTHKAQSVGYYPEIILAGRRINDSMASFAVTQVIKLMAQKNIRIDNARVLIMGLSFKENCPDIRNSKVVDIVHQLQDYNCLVDIYDPLVYAEEASDEYGLQLTKYLKHNFYDAILLPVAHDIFIELGIELIHSLGKSIHIFCDFKGIFNIDDSDFRL